MYRKAMASADLKFGIENVLRRIDEAVGRRPSNISAAKPLLVAASKTQSAETVALAYSAGQMHFGENYAQELMDKGNSPIILEQCKDIKWHYIGHLQTNKINKVLKTPGLYMIQTVDSEKLANNLNSAWGRLEGKNKEPIRVLVQVNTSGEVEKNGVKPNEATALYKYIKENLPNLKVEGVMTIGQYDFDSSKGPNPDFLSLLQCRDEICKEYNLKPEDVKVSMGMSSDFEQAIEMGSTIVRVGTSIFGARPKKQ